METSPFDWMRVGHWTDDEAMTGCTVVTFDGPVVASGEVRGGAPATREFALLEPTKLVESVDAVCLSGGSAFGLASGDGVMRRLQSLNVGFDTTFGAVPIVVGMSLYDLGVGNSAVFPDAESGAQAFDNASADFAIGAVGVGVGATVSKWRGADAVKPGGLGFAVVTKDHLTVCALVAVNAVGDIKTDTKTSTAIASNSFDWPETESALRENTTIGVVATNAVVTKAGCRSIAEAGHDGLARSIQPSHGPADGDALVAVSKPTVEADIATVRLIAAVAVERAVTSLV